MSETGSSSLMTTLGFVEGEALTYLGTHGATTLRRLIRELEWSSQMVTMAVGALVRQGLARAKQHELEVIVEAVPEHARGIEVRGSAPEVWGG